MLSLLCAAHNRLFEIHIARTFFGVISGHTVVASTSPMPEMTAMLEFLQIMLPLFLFILFPILVPTAVEVVGRIRDHVDRLRVAHADPCESR